MMLNNEVTILVNKVNEVYGDYSAEQKFGVCYLLAKKYFMSVPIVNIEYISKYVDNCVIRFFENVYVADWKAPFTFPGTTNKVEAMLGAMQHFLREFVGLNKPFFTPELNALIKLLMEIDGDSQILFRGFKEDSVVSKLFNQQYFDLCAGHKDGHIYLSDSNDELEDMVFMCADVIADMNADKCSPSPMWFTDKQGKKAAAFLQEDMVAHLADVDEEEQMFDRAFIQPVFGQKVKDGSYKEFLEDKYCLYDRFPCIKPNTDELWLEALLVMEHMPENGLAWMLVNNNALTCKQDQAVREYMLEKGYIETVISMPPKFIEGTAIRTSLVGMRKCHHDGVRFIDAMEMSVKGRRQNDIDYKVLEEVIMGLNSNIEFSTTLSYEFLKNNSLPLASENVMSISESEYDTNCSDLPKEKVAMKDLVKIKRTVPLTAKQLDAITSNEPTGKYYMRLGDIQNGMISDKLTPTSAKLEDYDRYWLKNEDVLLSKLGTPDFKTAIVEIEGDEHILPIGNIYILRPDKAKIEPYYLKYYLDSRIGREIINSLVTGDSVVMLTADSLKKMEIAVPKMELQKRIGLKYKDALDRVRRAQKELNAALDALQNCEIED